MVTRSIVLRTKQGQIVELPKEVAFPEDVREVEITMVGRSRVITPVGHRWDDFYQRGARASADFMIEREDPEPEERKSF